MYSKEQTGHGLLLGRNLTKLAKLAYIIEFNKDKCKVVPRVEETPAAGTGSDRLCTSSAQNLGFFWVMS